MSLRRTIRYSDHPAAALLRWLYYLPGRVSLPVPGALIRPIVSVYLLVRTVTYFLRRIFLAEPFLKAHCRKYGRNLHTGIFLHWIQGSGDLIVGDDVTIDGKCSFKFAARYVERPRLVIGDRSGISHGCMFTVGREISIGRHCRIASEVHIFDSAGHANDPAGRKDGEAAPDHRVQAVRIGDNVCLHRSPSLGTMVLSPPLSGALAAVPPVPH